MSKKEQWIKELSLLPHPEGGFYRETYRSDELIEIGPHSAGNPKKRSLCTGIYFLLEKENFSAFHKIQSDEMWHFYDGDPLMIHMIDEKGKYSNQLIGRNVKNGERLQFVVNGGVWFASEVVGEGSFSLVGCTVSFGFDFEDFELAGLSLVRKFPQHQRLLNRLIR